MNSLSPLIQKKLKTIVFDLDGVITSEKRYWNTARFTVWELLESGSYLGLKGYFNIKTGKILQSGEKIIASELIYELKNRAINSNWDITYVIACLHIVGIIKQSQNDSWANIFNADIPAEEKLKRVGQLLIKDNHNLKIDGSIIKQFFEGAGASTALLDYVTSFTGDTLKIEPSFFKHRGELCQLCYDNFQQWYDGRKMLTDIVAPTQQKTDPLSGHERLETYAVQSLAVEEKMVINSVRIKATLAHLQRSGRYILGIATGRPKNEAVEPLHTADLLQYFDKKHIVTHDDVVEAEAILTRSGKNIRLGKPHPFVLLKAIYPDESIERLCSEQFLQLDHHEAAFVGDSSSDVVAAKRAGCVSIGVLTGLGKGKTAKENKRKKLTELGCDIILNNVLELPQALGVKPTDTDKKQSKIESMLHHRTL